MTDNKTKPTAAAADAPQVHEEITSVVANSAKKGKLLLSIFFGALAVLGYSVITTKEKKNDNLQGTEQFDAARRGSGAPGELPPPPEQLTTPGGANRAVYSATDALDEARFRSPMILYNKPAAPAPASAGRTATTGVPQGAPTPNTSGGGAGGAQQGEAAPGQAAGQAPAGPVYVGFSQAEAAGATVMGDRNFMVAQGKLLDGILETAVNSDHPGMVRALISHDIYADTGRSVLFPRGSRIVGRYDSAVVKGQARVFIVWSRIIRPDGTDIVLDSPGTDPLGRSGSEGDVNNHFFQIFGTAAVLSIIGVGTATVGVQPQDQNNSISQYRSGVAESFNRTASSALDQNMNIKPTITLNQGIQIKIFVSRDLIFDPILVNRPQTTVIR